MEQGVLQGQPIESFVAAGMSWSKADTAQKRQELLSYTILLISNSAPLQDSTNKELLASFYFH